MRWPRIIIPCLLAFLLGSAVGAEQRVSPRGSSAAQELARFEAALPRLNLWPEQKPRIQKLLQQVKADLKKIEAGPGTPEQKRPKLQALRDRARKQLNEIITVAQAEKLNRMLSPGPSAPRAPSRPK